MTLCVEVIVSFSHQIIGLGNIVSASNCLTGRVDVVVITIHINQTGIVSAVVDIVIQTTRFLNQAVLTLDDHSAFTIELIVTGRHHTIVFSHVVLASNHLTAAVDVIVVTTHVDQTSIRLSAVNIVVNVAFLFHEALQHSVVIAEFTVGRFHQTIGLVNIVLTGDCRVASLEVVVITIHIL